ncbi:MAG: hypothetical protein AAF621_06300 [Pseudomonadota bacterium]
MYLFFTAFFLILALICFYLAFKVNAPKTSNRSIIVRRKKLFGSKKEDIDNFIVHEVFCNLTVARNEMRFKLNHPVGA